MYFKFHKKFYFYLKFKNNNNFIALYMLRKQKLYGDLQ